MSIYPKDEFIATDLMDELRVDRRVQQVLKDFHQNYLLGELDLEPLEAGAQAAGTDYLLRDFIIDHCRENIFDLSATRVRQFGGNWYIVKNLEPNMQELLRSLKGVAHFARFCVTAGMMEPATADAIVDAASDHAWYDQRIEAFFDLQPGDDYKNWCNDCSLKDVGEIR